MQLNLSTAAEAYLTVDSDDFYVQLDLTSNDTNFNNTHPRLQVRPMSCQVFSSLPGLLGLPTAARVDVFKERLVS